MIEGGVLKGLALTAFLPAGYKHQARVAGAVDALMAIGTSCDLVANQKADVEVLAQLIGDLKAAVTLLDHTVEAAESGSLAEKAAAFAVSVAEAMGGVREVCDKLEGLVDDGLWPLPKYREMLFLV